MRNELDGQGFQSHRVTECILGFLVHGIRNLLSHFQSSAAKRYQSSSGYSAIERELESAHVDSDSFVLPNVKGFHSSIEGHKRFNARQGTTNHCRGKSKEEQRIVPTLTLPANKHLRIRLKLRSQGLVRFHVEASMPVNTYIFDEDGIAEFHATGIYDMSYGGFIRRKIHDQTVRLFLNGAWFLIILNPQRSSVAVHYEVYY